MFITPILFLSTSCSRWLMDSLDATCSETESNCAQNCARYVTVSVSTRYRCVLVTLHGFGSEWKCNKLSDQTRESLLSLLFCCSVVPLCPCDDVSLFLISPHNAENAEAGNSKSHDFISDAEDKKTTRFTDVRSPAKIKIKTSLLTNSLK